MAAPPSSFGSGPVNVPQGRAHGAMRAPTVAMEVAEICAEDEGFKQQKWGACKTNQSFCDDIMYIYIYHGDESCGYDSTMVRLTQTHHTLGLNMT